MSHSCEYILTAYYINKSNLHILGELFIFRLNKDSIKDVILKYGGYAHGTKQQLGPITLEKLEDKTNNNEYAIRPIYGDNCWRCLLKYRTHEISIQTN
jgi:hypothetical protein